MKRKYWFGLAGALALGVVVLAIVARADSYTFLGSLATVDNTTENSPALAVGGFSLPRGVFLISHGTLTETNALRINIQVSLDGSNFITAATWWPARTNAWSVNFSPNYAAQTIWLRAQAVTTNAVQVGANYLY